MVLESVVCDVMEPVDPCGVRLAEVERRIDVRRQDLVPLMGFSGPAPVGWAHLMVMREKRYFAVLVILSWDRPVVGED